MTSWEQNPPVPTAPMGPQIADDLAWSDLTAALGAGWRDFLSMPRFGMFFGESLWNITAKSRHNRMHIQSSHSF